MPFFESVLTLLLVAIASLQVSRRLNIPYPSMLALAGVAVAALPWAPDIGIDPRLALALFIAPALLDAAYDLPPRALGDNWRPLLALAAVAVLLTTAAVAWIGVTFAGLPVAAAIALGAIVAPPDAAASSAMLSRFALPRRTVAVLKGESLLNDATALLVFSAAVAANGATTTNTLLFTELLLAAPGGLILGYVLARLYIAVSSGLAGTLGGTLFEFVTVFGAWIIAEHVHVSAVLCVVAFAMTIATHIPERQSPRDRIHSYAVWETSVFLLNVLAFLLMGLQAKAIISRLEPNGVWDAVWFASMVFVVVISVRAAWVMLYNRVLWVWARQSGVNAPTLAQGVLVSWCGMRGLVTMAAALALPTDFPGRDLIVLSALAVVLGTLILQGLTLGPLIRYLDFQPDASFDESAAKVRVALIDAAVATLAGRDDEPARRLREIYQEDREAAILGRHPRDANELDKLRRKTIAIKRSKLAELRRSGEIDDDVFHAIEQDLDFAELAASPPDRLEMMEG
ncbi:MAG: sodium:proton antiporter [Hyphomicrobiaceae bacterium]|nr:sodium:proton antiporter [Hyphomicrobiaceae bacterium]